MCYEGTFHKYLPYCRIQRAKIEEKETKLFKRIFSFFKKMKTIKLVIKAR